MIRSCAWDHATLPYTPPTPCLVFYTVPGDPVLRVAAPDARGRYHALVPGLPYQEQVLAAEPLFERAVEATEAVRETMPVLAPNRGERRYVSQRASDVSTTASSSTGVDVVSSSGSASSAGSRSSASSDGRYDDDSEARLPPLPPSHSGAHSVLASEASARGRSTATSLRARGSFKRPRSEDSDS